MPGAGITVSVNAKSAPWLRRQNACAPPLPSRPGSILCSVAADTGQGHYTEIAVVPLYFGHGNSEPICIDGADIKTSLVPRMHLGSSCDFNKGRTARIPPARKIIRKTDVEAPARGPSSCRRTAPRVAAKHGHRVCDQRLRFARKTVLEWPMPPRRPAIADIDPAPLFGSIGCPRHPPGPFRQPSRCRVDCCSLFRNADVHNTRTCR